MCVGVVGVGGEALVVPVEGVLIAPQLAQSCRIVAEHLLPPPGIRKDVWVCIWVGDCVCIWVCIWVGGSVGGSV